MTPSAITKVFENAPATVQGFVLLVKTVHGEQNYTSEGLTPDERVKLLSDALTPPVLPAGI